LDNHWHDLAGRHIVVFGNTFRNRSQVKPFGNILDFLMKGVSAAHNINFTPEAQMREKINEEVSVVMFYSAAKRTAQPYSISWQNKEYMVGKIGYYHTIKDGATLHHIYELIDKQETLWFRLNLNTSNLHWTLEAIHDGLAT